MNILVDSSVWIDYFRSGLNSEQLDGYIDHNLICINDPILAELVPFLKVKKQFRLVQLLSKITRIPLTINWQILFTCKPFACKMVLVKWVYLIILF